MLFKVECDFTVTFTAIDLSSHWAPGSGYSITQSLAPDAYYDEITDKGAWAGLADRSMSWSGLVELPDCYLDDGYGDGQFDFDELAEFINGLFSKGDLVIDCMAADIRGIAGVFIDQINFIERAGEDCRIRYYNLANDMFDNPIKDNPINKEGKMNNNLQSTIDKLVGLRKQANGLGMEAAKIFNEAKESKSYKSEFKTFEEFCKVTGWARGTVYDLIKVYNVPSLRDNFTDLGLMKAKTIYQAKLEDSQMLDAIEYAKNATAEDLKDYLKQSQEQSEQSQEDTDTLADLLAKQSQLVSEKARLEERLADIMVEMSSLAAEIEAMSK